MDETRLGPKVCATPISVMRFVMGQFPLPNGFFINDRYKVNPLDQWGIILAMEMGFVDHLGLGLGKKSYCF